MPIERPKVRTPTPDIQKKKDWEKVTSYRPSHDGVSSPKLAHLPNVANTEATQNLINDKRQHIKFVSADIKTTFDQIEAEEKLEEKRREKQIEEVEEV